MWKIWTRERLAVADVQAITDQTILPYASAAARDAAIPQGSRKAGMVAFTSDTGTWWGWDAINTTWQPIALYGSPITTVPVNTGWTAHAAQIPRVQKTGDGNARLMGWVQNSGSYLANASNLHYPLTLPVGFAPATLQVFDIPVGDASMARIAVMPDRRVRVSSTFGNTFAAAAAHVLDGVEYHLNYIGT